MTSHVLRSLNAWLRAVSIAALAAAAAAQQHTHGTMVGALQPTSVVVWTRTADLALVRVLYGTSPTLTNPSSTATFATDHARDHTVRIPVTGLTPDTRYYYATHLTHPDAPNQTATGRIGTFRTPPLPTSPSPVRFIATGDVFDHAQYDIFDRMRQAAADFFVSMGDMPYADGARTRPDYWRAHRAIRDEPRWRDLIEALPVEAIWDDHEVANDWDGATDANLVASGTGAFFDYYPLPIGAKEIYRSIRWGAGLELFLLDCRSKRGVNLAPSGPGKSMLGAAQLAWLKNGLQSSTATFKVVCTSVPLRWGKATMDDWEGFMHERRELLGFITDNRIENVSFLTADNHLVSVHHHRNGIREYMCGPAAQFTRPQVPGDPEVRFRASVRNYLRVSVDPAAQPATIAFEYFSADGKLVYAETARAEPRATVRVQTDEPGGEVQLKGPYFLRDRGRDIRLPAVEPGRYDVRFEPERWLTGHAADLVLDVPPGAHADIAGRWREVPGAEVLLAESFDGPLQGHVIVDERGATGGPSAWLTDAGVLQQAGLIGGPVGNHDSDRPGTMLITGDPTWSDYSVRCRMKSNHNGRLGLVFRYQDPDNFYRFFQDSGTPVRRLEKKVNGVFTVLAEQKIPYLPYSFNDVKCVCRGTALSVVYNGVEILTATDTAFSSGKVGIWVWSCLLTEFEDLVVRKDDAFRKTVNVVLEDDFEDQVLRGWTPQDHATNSGSSSWIETASVLLQSSNIGDVDPNDPIAAPGTVLLPDIAIPDDVQFSARLSSINEGAMGVVFRYRDAANHYRFVMNRRDRFRQLQKVVGGTWSILWEDRGDFNRTQWYRVRCVSEADRHRVYLDGELLADVRDATHKSGKAGFYVWQNPGVLLDNARFQTPHTALPVLAAVTTGFTTALQGRAPGSPNLRYGIGLSLGRTPGIPLSLLNPADPRILGLNPDSLFRASLAPSTLWTGLQGGLDAEGRFRATISWPQIPALKGTRIYIAGWTGDITRVPVKDVFPTLEFIYP